MSALLIIAVLAVAAWLLRRRGAKLPGPTPLPVLGSLHLLGRHESPFQAFTELAKTYGDVFGLQLGGSRCLVVSSLERIREVLNQNGKFFGGRPDFLRFHQLFAGDRNNSLALCDWSNLQLRRRNLARRHCGPKAHTDNFARIGRVAAFEAVELVDALRTRARAAAGALDVKPLLMRAAMNMFAGYMCHARFDPDHDADFVRIVDHFDEIFWEINQGYAVDFLPWLAPFYSKHMAKLSTWASDIRAFILSRIVEQREAELDPDAPERDFLDGLLRVLRDDPTVDRNTIIFMLEDFLGGHSSVGNLVMLALAAVARDPAVGRRVRAEIDAATRGRRPVALADRPALPYTEATILECLRYASSPIVPHVATEDAVVAGLPVEKGTVVFINNYELNTSPAYWSEPDKFDPARFLERTRTRARRNSQCDSGMESDGERAEPRPERRPSRAERRPSAADERETYAVRRNIPHFLPFSIGKRTCIGQTLVTTMSFVMFANVVAEFEVGAEDAASLRQRPACAALPRETFRLHMLPRKR
ncbi:cytochrome P450 307a1 [Aricia agestis]|uniref:cytochrome P450 307a1 n=1 Tax=Aricia agestis TaxID=91739 RepID=UPI001C20A448|nr:cytochrome P450 307a1 [Aricia agestis]